MPTEEPTAEPEPTMEPSPYLPSDYMPQSRMKFVLDNGSEMWTMAMDDGVTVMVRTYAADGSESTWYYSYTDDGLYRGRGYNDGSQNERVIGRNPAIGDSAMAGKAVVVEILEEGVLLDNGDMVLTGIGVVPSGRSIASMPTQLTDEELARLQGIEPEMSSEEGEPVDEGGEGESPEE